MDYESIFLDNLNRVMKDRGLHQKDIADMAGVDQPRVSKVFKRKTFFTFEQALKIAKKCELSFDSMGMNQFNSLSEVYAALLSLFDLGLLKYENGNIKILNFKLHQALTQLDSLDSCHLPHELKSEVVELVRNDTLNKLREYRAENLFREPAESDILAEIEMELPFH